MAKVKRNSLACLIIAAISWSLGYFYNLHVGGELYWLRKMYHRKVELAETIDQPKLIVVGGSGVHFGLDSPLIEETVGRPVLNLGLEVPIGLNVILSTGLEQVNPEDIVLLIPEYILLLDDDGFGYRSGTFSILIGQPGIGGTSPKHLTQGGLGLGITSLREASKTTVDLLSQGKFTGYYDDPLNQQGDPILEKEHRETWNSKEIGQAVTPHAVEQMTQFKAAVESKGATLVIALPWLYGSTDDQSMGNVHQTIELLSDIAPVLYNPETLNIQTDSSLFSDTRYHLSKNGRQLRSKQLIEQLLTTFPDL